MSQIKERRECREKIMDILTEVGAVAVYDRYLKLRSMYFDNLGEKEKQKKQRRFNEDMRKQIEKMFYALHDVYAGLEREIRRDKQYRKCTKCGKRHMIHMEDFRKEVYGEPVQCMCSQCRPKSKF